MVFKTKPYLFLKIYLKIDVQPGSHRLNRSINPLDVNIAALRADNLDSTHRWRFITTVKYREVFSPPYF
jgi:hypothetical protein